MIKNILLTGGTGFLGSHILKGLVESQYNVIVLIREKSNQYRIQSITDKFGTFCIDDNGDNLKEVFAKYSIDTIIHTATEYGRNLNMSSILRTNLIFPIELIETGIQAGVKYFLNTDSFFGKEAFKNQAYLNEYTISKNFFLEYLFKASGKLKIVNMRLEHVFGELDSDTKFVANILLKLRANDQEILLTDGFQRRDFIYVGDVVNAYLKVISSINQIEDFKEFEIGRGESITVREFVQMLAEKSNSKSELKFGALPTRMGEIEDSFANTIELLRIGWKPNYDLQQAVTRIIELE